MKRTVFSPPAPPYRLHDAEARFEASGHLLILHLPDGMTKTGGSCSPADGRIEFHNVDWGFCYAYRFDSIGNVGPFTGEKHYLKDFIEKNRHLRFTIIAPVYSDRQARFFGYLPANESLQACIIEICYEGEMVFVEE